MEAATAHAVDALAALGLMLPGSTNGSTRPNGSIEALLPELSTAAQLTEEQAAAVMGILQRRMPPPSPSYQAPVDAAHRPQAQAAANRNPQSTDASSNQTSSSEADLCQAAQASPRGNAYSDGDAPPGAAPASPTSPSTSSTALDAKGGLLLPGTEAVAVTPGTYDYLSATAALGGAGADGPAQVAVHNVPFKWCNADLEDLFAGQPGYLDAQLLFHDNGRSKGVGVALFASRAEAQSAVAHLSGTHADGRRLDLLLMSPNNHMSFGSRQVAILGLPWEYSSADVRALLEAGAAAEGAPVPATGAVEKVVVAYRDDGKSEGRASAWFCSRDAARAAIRRLHHRETLAGLRLRLFFVQEAAQQPGGVAASGLGAGYNVYGGFAGYMPACMPGLAAAAGMGGMSGAAFAWQAPGLGGGDGNGLLPPPMLQHSLSLPPGIGAGAAAAAPDASYPHSTTSVSGDLLRSPAPVPPSPGLSTAPGGTSGNDSGAAAVDAATDDSAGPVILHVSGLHEAVTREQLRELFSAVGEVTKIDIPDGGRSMGYGFVTFASPAAAEQAMLQFNNYPLGGGAIHVAYSTSATAKARQQALRQARRAMLMNAGGCGGGGAAAAAAAAATAAAAGLPSGDVGAGSRQASVRRSSGDGSPGGAGATLSPLGAGGAPCPGSRIPLRHLSLDGRGSGGARGASPAPCTPGSIASPGGRFSLDSGVARWHASAQPPPPPPAPLASPGFAPPQPFGDASGGSGACYGLPASAPLFSDPTFGIGEFGAGGPEPAMVMQHASRQVYVSGLPPDLQEGQLAQLFAAVGPVESARKPRNKDYGFVRFQSLQSALVAVQALNGAALPGGGALTVQFSTSILDRPGVGAASPGQAGAFMARSPHAALSSAGTPQFDTSASMSMAMGGGFGAPLQGVRLQQPPPLFQAGAAGGLGVSQSPTGPLSPAFPPMWPPSAGGGLPPIPPSLRMLGGLGGPLGGSAPATPLPSGPSAGAGAQWQLPFSPQPPPRGTPPPFGQFGGADAAASAGLLPQHGAGGAGQQVDMALAQQLMMMGWDVQAAVAAASVSADMLMQQQPLWLGDAGAGDDSGSLLSGGGMPQHPLAGRRSMLSAAAAPWPPRSSAGDGFDTEEGGQYSGVHASGSLALPPHSASGLILPSERPGAHLGLGMQNGVLRRSTDSGSSGGHAQPAEGEYEGRAQEVQYDLHQAATAASPRPRGGSAHGAQGGEGAYQEMSGRLPECLLPEL